MAEPPAVGSRVEIRGLASRTELNGRVGTVVAWDAERGRATVKLGERSLGVRPSSLCPVDEVDGTSFECAICWADVEGRPAELPCCGAPPPGSSTSYCVRCIEVICETALGGMGRCPTCREFIQCVDGGLQVAAGCEECAVCHQARPVAERMGGQQPLCAACGVGIRSPLRYECERCHRVGPVPHPMYRYQPSAAEFGNNPWFCQPCADFTNRRVVPADVARVPPDDCPESWGRRDEWFAAVRAQRAREQAAREETGRPLAGVDPPGRERARPRRLRLALAVLAAAWLYAQWRRTGDASTYGIGNAPLD